MEMKMSAHEFNVVYERYKNLLYRIAYTYLKNSDDVEDLLQEVFVKRLCNAPSFETEEHETRWMIRVTVNLAKNTVKSYWHRNRVNMDDLPEVPEVLQWQWDETDKSVYSEVMALPDKQRIVIYLHYYEEYTCKEIANILNCKESTVKMRLKKGRDLLRLKLSKEGFAWN
ncbi:MAG: RNA polymerase sigma factor [Clostridium sp.]|nr:RNA polymerase sigma factor [Clostridium sp.]